MEQSFEAMTIAMRVLTALNEKRPPDPRDLDYLRKVASTRAHIPPDELACEVIQQAIKHRSEVRIAGRSVNEPLQG
jgi:hypothetical protein